VPAILEYLPYRKRDGTHVRDALTHPYLAGHGYACVRVDMRGNGDSDGLLFDEYTQRELDDACDVIAWLRQQSWCSGNVGMMGISWAASTACRLQPCAPRASRPSSPCAPPTTVTPTTSTTKVAACSMKTWAGRRPCLPTHRGQPTRPSSVRAGATSGCSGWKTSPCWPSSGSSQHRDAYWKHGSVDEDFGAIQAAVSAVGGWNDAYTNAVPRLVSHLKAPAKGIIGPWAHQYPHFAVPEPRIGFLQEALRWWGHWLKGIDTQVESDPAFRTYIMELGRPGGSVTHIPGRWVSDSRWPFDRGEVQRWHLNADGLSREKGRAKKQAHRSGQQVGADGGEYCIIWLGPEFAGDQRYDDAGSLTFDSAPLAQAIDLVGAPALTLKFSADKPVANVAVRLNAVWPDGAVSRLSCAVFNLCAPRQPPAPRKPWSRARCTPCRRPLDDVRTAVCPKATRCGVLARPPATGP